MGFLSTMYCTTVGCSNEAAEKVNDDLLCTQCIKRVIQFPCKIKFTVVPYVGVHRSLVHDCADQAQCDSYIDFLMSDTTGNTRNVMHSVYVAPKPAK